METLKTLCTLTVGGRDNWYATNPTLAKISNGPQYLGANFENLPNLKEIFLGFTFMYKSTHLELSFGFHLYNIPIDYMSRITNIFLQNGNMENAMYFNGRW